jgi:hypothetical protein
MDNTIHTRDIAVDAAATELVQWTTDWRIRHQLTDVEFMHMMVQLCKTELQRLGMVERFGLLQLGLLQRERNVGTVTNPDSGYDAPGRGG